MWLRDVINSKPERFRLYLTDSTGNKTLKGKSFAGIIFKDKIVSILKNLESDNAIKILENLDVEEKKIIDLTDKFKIFLSIFLDIDVFTKMKDIK